MPGGQEAKTGLSLEDQETVEQGRKLYLKLREKGLNLIEPRQAEDSFNPEASRTLMDLLGESAHRARNLIESSCLPKGPLPGPVKLPPLDPRSTT